MNPIEAFYKYLWFVKIAISARNNDKTLFKIVVVE